jgi:hypothetical protein
MKELSKVKSQDGFLTVLINKGKPIGGKISVSIPESRAKDKLFGIDYDNVNLKRTSDKNGNARYANTNIQGVSL